MCADYPTLLVKIVDHALATFASSKNPITTGDSLQTVGLEQQDRDYTSTLMHLLYTVHKRTKTHAFAESMRGFGNFLFCNAQRINVSSAYSCCCCCCCCCYCYCFSSSLSTTTSLSSSSSSSSSKTTKTTKTTR